MAWIVVPVLLSLINPYLPPSSPSLFRLIVDQSSDVSPSLFRFTQFPPICRRGLQRDVLSPHRGFPCLGDDLFAFCFFCRLVWGGPTQSLFLVSRYLCVLTYVLTLATPLFSSSREGGGTLVMKTDVITTHD